MSTLITPRVTAETLTGTTLNSTITGSSLTTIGTITNGGLGTGATLGAVTVNIASSAVGDIWYAGASNVMTRLASVAAGSFLRSGGVTTAPAWSTAIMPNTAVSGQILFGTATNVWGQSSQLAFTTASGLTINGTANTNQNICSLVYNGQTQESTGGCLITNTSSNSLNVVKLGVIIQATTNTGIAAVGLGASTVFKLSRNDGTAVFESGRLTSNWVTSSATNNNNGKISLWATNNAGSAGTNKEILSASVSGVFIGTQTSSTISTALLHLAAGTATVSTAPLKFTSGTNLTTAEAGAMEYDGTNLFFTRSGTTRESVICANAVNVVSPTSPDRTITVIIAGTTYFIAAKTTNN